MFLEVRSNEYGTPVDAYRCETCGEEFTVCPAHKDRSCDDQWTGCQAPECASYDPGRDVDKWFDEGRVRVIPEADGRARLVPFRVIDGDQS